MSEGSLLTLPTALVIGPMKCGTSWIHDYLKARGDVCLPHLVKETFYFDRFHDRGVKWYADFFASAHSDSYHGVVEVAPSLFHRSNDLPKEIRAELGDIPILITLRDPVARAWSHYQHMRRGYTREPLVEAVRIFPEIIDASRYSKHLPRWQESFSNVTILQQSQLIADAEAFALAVSRALDLPPFAAGRLAKSRSNSATAPYSFWLANSGRIASNALRSAGFYGIVDMARRAGLKRLFFGAPTISSQAPSLDEVELLRSMLEAELRSACGSCSDLSSLAGTPP